MREGDAVVRPCYPSSPAVHRLLRHLEAVGFGGAPRFLGSDGRTERLGWIPGRSGQSGWTCTLPEEGLLQAARLLRRYHDAVAHFTPGAGDEWTSGRTTRSEGEVVLHGDPGPWNMVWDDDGVPVALIDWDHATPGRPVEDLAYLVTYAAPLAADDAEAVSWMHHPGPPDRVRRLRLLADGYGTTAAGLVDEAIAVMAKTNRTVERMAGLGLEPQRTWVADGARGKAERLWARHDWMVQHRDEWVDQPFT